MTDKPQPKPGILDIQPYVPGKANPIKMSANENALGSSPAAREAFAEAAMKLHLYPDPRATSLRKAIAAKYNLEPERLIFGCGSDEVFAILADAYLSPGDNAVQGEYGFAAFAIATCKEGAEIRSAPEPNYTLDVDEMLKLVDERTKIVWVANPANPTGTWLPGEEIRRLHAALPSNVLLMIIPLAPTLGVAIGLLLGRSVLSALPVMTIHTIGVALAVSHMGQKIRHKNRQLDELSRTDSLTGLYVRRHWLELAERALRRHRDTRAPMGLLLLDIDHFKVANDRHGHSVGDEVLRAVAGAIAATLRASDAAGRYGGDEFGVLLGDTTPDQARALAEKMLAAIREAPIGGMPGTRVTASIGLAAARAGHVTVEQWIDEADAALYRAKHAGRDRIGS